MSDTAEIESEFWPRLRAERTVMLGIAGQEDGRLRPLTALLEKDGRGPIWFFASRESEWVQRLEGQQRAVLGYVAKGHDLFASLEGELVQSGDQAVIDRLWNPFIAAWYEGKDDPKLVLLRFTADRAEIWRDGATLLAGIEMLLGTTPKEALKDNMEKLVLG